MEIIIGVLAYVACCFAAYPLLKRGWMGKFDYTRGDRVFCVTMSCLGPISAILGLVVFIAPYVGQLGGDSNEIIERRKHP